MSKVGRVSFVTLIMVLIMAQPGSGYYPWERVYHIHILNRMSNKAPPLTVHVTSKNHDLQEHTIGKDGDFQFHYRPNFWYNTVFNCVFKSGGKTKAFDIYKPGDYSYGSKVCRLLKQRPVNWKVQDDGFYRSCDGENYQKMYDWGVSVNDDVDQRNALSPF